MWKRETQINIMEAFNQLLDKILFGITLVALFVHVLFLALAVWRAWRGENSFDRLIGLDLAGVLLFCVLMSFAILSEIYPPLRGNVDNVLFVDVGLGLVAVSYLSTIALAKYIIDHRMF